MTLVWSFRVPKGILAIALMYFCAARIAQLFPNQHGKPLWYRKPFRASLSVHGQAAGYYIIQWR